MELLGSGFAQILYRNHYSIAYKCSEHSESPEHDSEIKETLLMSALPSASELVAWWALGSAGAVTDVPNVILVLLPRHKAVVSLP